MTIVATMPPAKNIIIAIACSAVLAVPATLAPSAMSISIIMSMPNVTSGPGSARAIQSNTSNGANDRSCHFWAKYMSAIIGAVMRPPTSAPKPKVCIFTMASSHTCNAESAILDSRAGA